MNDTTKSQPVVKFFEPKDVGSRDWGREILVAHAPCLYTGKLLLLKKGHKGGLQKHHLKDESAYVYSGKLIFRYDDGTGNIMERELGPGDSVHIPTGAVHQTEALTDCVIFEVSTPHFNDRIRVEEDYGLSDEEGLPSTALDEVEFR